MTLTVEQLEIIGHDPTSHARVLAGPGTGKSFTSVEYLAKIKESHPNLRVQYITFTRIATAEFTAQLPAELREVMSDRLPSTVHGFALSQLLRHRYGARGASLRMPDSWENQKLIHKDLSIVLRARGFDSATPGMIKKLEQEMSAGFESLDPEVVLDSQRDPALRQAYIGAWQQHRRNFGYILQSELTYDAGNMLRDMDDIDLGVDTLIVDEYQDLNKADIQLIKT